ncbi:MAG: DUF3127 domain-containing protein [Rikenellaceae bacterium]|jgi:hypothetical protein|nr:DUF3127 domain-containing protein [Rikenellaceae bacterium]
MDFEGLIYRVLPQVKGSSARGEWVKQEVILELPGEFSRKLCVSFWGDRAQDSANLKEGETVTVSANVESKEYNGRWYTEVRAWRVSRKTADSQSVPPADLPPFAVGDEPLPPAAKEEVDDLPF